MSVALRSPEATISLAKALAKATPRGSCITLKGDLGTGKTTFARAFIQALTSETTDVISPTFVLVQTYDVILEGSPATLWHADLYRLKHESEFHELGIEEAFEQGVALIEWPELVMGYLPQHRLDITLGYGQNDSERLLSLDAKGHWKEALEHAMNSDA